MSRFEPDHAYVDRLALEHELVKRYTPNYKLRRDSDGLYCFDGKQYACSGRAYRMRLMLGRGFPIEMPRLVLIEPSIIPAYDGNGWG